jgi:hypothetical protein
MSPAEQIAYEHGREVVRRRRDTARVERAAALERARIRDHKSAAKENARNDGA